MNPENWNSIYNRRNSVNGGSVRGVQLYITLCGFCKPGYISYYSYYRFFSIWYGPHTYASRSKQLKNIISLFLRTHLLVFFSDVVWCKINIMYASFCCICKMHCICNILLHTQQFHNAYTSYVFHICVLHMQNLVANATFSQEGNLSKSARWLWLLVMAVAWVWVWLLWSGWYGFGLMWNGWWMWMAKYFLMFE